MVLAVSAGAALLVTPSSNGRPRASEELAERLTGCRVYLRMDDIPEGGRYFMLCPWGAVGIFTIDRGFVERKLIKSWPKDVPRPINAHSLYSEGESRDYYAQFTVRGPPREAASSYHQLLEAKGYAVTELIYFANGGDNDSFGFTATNPRHNQITVASSLWPYNKAFHKTVSKLRVTVSDLPPSTGAASDASS